MKSFLFIALLMLSTLSFAQQVSITEGSNDVTLDITLNYQSHWSVEDINRAINPVNGGIQQLFNDPINLRRAGTNRYNVSSTISMGPMSMNFNSLLDYSQGARGQGAVHQFRFYNFDHLFKSTTITVDVKTGTNLSSVSIHQVGIIKKESYQKLKSIPFGTSTFKGRILKNIKKFRSSTGGN